MPEEPGANPPYYINRIEELLRRADLFVSVLTQREPGPGDFPAGGSRLRCSPYSLFEIRLAERADIPRLVLYERSTGFKPPRVQRSWEAYVPFDRGTHDDRPEQSQWTKVVEPKIRQWQDWTADHRKPASYEQSTQAMILVDDHAQESLRGVLEDCVRDAGYEPDHCDVERVGSGAALRQVREAGLVIHDFSTASSRLTQVYAAAHALGIPTIRLLAQGEETALPWLIEGEPGGYHLDLVRWRSLDEVAPLVRPRVDAMFRLSPGLRGAEGADYLQSKRYAHLLVFISHTLKPPQRTLVDLIYSKFASRHVTPFEYHHVNKAGIDWAKALNEALDKTTHFVVLLSGEYERSQTCTTEIEHILARKNRDEKVTILPFMTDGRSTPHPKLTHMHHTLLDATQDANAETIVAQVMASLEETVRGKQTT